MSDQGGQESSLGLSSFYARISSFTLALRKSPIVVFLEIIGILGVIAAVVAFMFELRDRQDDRINRSWQLLSMHVSGNAGKIRAMEYLNEETCFSIPVDWIFLGECWKTREDFSTLKSLSNRYTASGSSGMECTIRGNEETGVSKLVCPAQSGDAVYLQNVKLPNAILKSIHAHNADFTNADLTNADFENATLYGITLVKADLTDTNFKMADLREADLTGANVSNAKLGNLEHYGNTMFDCIWAYEDAPKPTLVPEAKEKITYIENTEMGRRDWLESPGKNQKSKLDLCIDKAMSDKTN